MKRILLLLMTILSMLGVSAQQNGDYRSIGSVSLTSSTNWEVYSSATTTWSVAVVAPNSASLVNGNIITIQAAHIWNNSTVSTIPVGVTVVCQSTTIGTFSTTNKIELNGTLVIYTAASPGNILSGMNINTGSTIIYRASTSVKPSPVYGGRTYYNLSFDTDATITTPVSNSTFSQPAPGAQWTVNGTLYVKGWSASFYHCSNTFGNFNGDITITGTGTIVRLKNTTIASGKTLTIDGGATLNLGGTTSDGSCGTAQSTTLTINGSLVNKSTNNIGFTAASLVVSSGGTYKHDVNGGSIPNTNTTYSAGSTINVTGITNVANIPVLPTSCGNVIWNCAGQSSSNTFINTISNTTTVNGDLTIQSTGTATIYLGGAATSRTLTVTGNLNVTGGKLGVIKAPSGGATANQTCNVNGDVLINGGEFYVSDANGVTSTAKGYLNVDGSLNHTAGVFGSTATSVSNSGVITFTGNNTGKTISTIGFSNNTNIIIDKTATGDISLASALSVNAASRLTIQTGTLKLNANTVTLKSTSATNTARVYVNSGAVDQSVSGSKFIIEQYIPGGTRAYRFFGHPFNHSINLSELTDDIDITGTDGGNIAGTGFTSTGSNAASAFWYDPISGNSNTSAGWIAFTRNDGVNAAAGLGNTKNSWDQGQGIRVLVRGPKGQTGILGSSPPAPNATTISLSGKINDGNDVPVNLIKSANSGYNLIANPYCAPLDIYQFRTSNSNENAIAGNNFYIWVPSGGVNGKGQYITGDMTNAGETYRYIPTYSSFFIDVAASSTATFRESHKAVASTNASYSLRGASTSAYGNNTLQLQVSRNGDFEDRILILMNDSTAKGIFDSKDARKLDNSNLNFYSLSEDSIKLAIDRRQAYLNKEAIISLGFTTTLTAVYSIEVKDFMFDPETVVILRDNFLNTEKTLDKGATYTFSVSSDSGSMGNQRFQLVFRRVIQYSPIQPVAFDFKVFPNPATQTCKISFTNPLQEDIHVLITTASGVLVRSIDAGRLLKNTIDVDLDKLSKGIYYVTVVSTLNRKTQKIVIL